jgi:hypothetical protein
MRVRRSTTLEPGRRGIKAMSDKLARTIESLAIKGARSEVQRETAALREAFEGAGSSRPSKQQSTSDKRSQQTNAPRRESK